MTTLDNPVAMTVYNTTPAQLSLTKEAVASVLAQDIPMRLYIWNNGSTEPETWPWLTAMAVDDQRIEIVGNSPDNRSPVAIGNRVLEYLFNTLQADYILGVPNDVILPTNFYRECLRWPRGMVTASQTSERDFPKVDVSRAVSDHTPAAVALLRRWFYTSLVSKDGYFSDERYKVYVNDVDMSLRMASCGIRGIQLDMQYFHSGSASWRLATPEVGRAITDQADIDRAEFVKKWGFAVDDAQYANSCGDINFRGAPQNGNP